MIMQLDLTKKIAVASQDVNVDYTKRIILALKSKAKKDVCPFNKASINDLTQVFICGAADKKEGFSPMECGFARVNMFLRILDPSSVIAEFKEASASVNSKKLMFNFSGYLSPKEEDFIKAKQDIIDNSLDFCFASIDDLYLNESSAGNYLSSFI